MKQKTSQKKILRGTVVSDKGDKTIVVLVDRFVKVPKYRKYVTRSKKYHAHDPHNVGEIGAMVSIEECRPISKKKSFRIVEERQNMDK